jgi:thiol-disulfide isomerase/thioredoxin
MRSFMGSVLAALASIASVAAPAPQVAVSSFNQLAQPLPFPYDEQANAQQVVAAAQARAAHDHKLLLIDLGGNWCGDCRVLAGTMALPELRAFIEKHYVVVTVDVGRFDKNLSIPAHYGLGRPAGVPSLLIVNPKTNAVINQGHTEALADARKMSPQALADWLASWTS